ncbi:hypothetical protein ACFS5J_00415 [Flavobacterium chuncheonense]|uniref:Uncharacterized protein n=1 Tax=Flavobacterium chuncheonense TaxID=2026653 RepID=A0ABW5YHI2_9FLAO
MKTHFLFPNFFKTIGWIILIPSCILSLYVLRTDSVIKILNFNVLAIYYDEILGIKSGFFEIIENNLTDELIVFGLIVGALLVGFSKMKNEDEMITKIRYESLVWSTYFSYGLLLGFNLFFYGPTFYSIIIYNTFTFMLFFIIRFHFMIYKLNKASNDEE